MFYGSIITKGLSHFFPGSDKFLNMAQTMTTGLKIVAKNSFPPSLKNPLFTLFKYSFEDKNFWVCLNLGIPKYLILVSNASNVFLANSKSRHVKN